eukprot:CAMPEP_0170812866 /NCGR_PEP_ID=MMETSP0733-20121128/36375_1 /TAXON_ID=186038 /ORGANISM="Fragilariopsis kerguelensis, Strain L26-C5" /LENGTH=55 /DNA_ID=CAMNT_0011169829 /DNA_START=649 /DNA_END=816 /DNA_ORIENTATION=+
MSSFFDDNDSAVAGAGSMPVTSRGVCSRNIKTFDLSELSIDEFTIFMFIMMWWYM